MSAHMSNYSDNRNPHAPIIRKVANHSRSDVLNTMQNAIVCSNNVNYSAMQKNRCAISAESSTELKKSEPNTLINPTINHCAGIKSVAVNDTARLKPTNHLECITNSSGIKGRNEKRICANNEAAIGKKSRGFVDGYNVVCSMCGDVGIAELLFFCCKCSHRHQHIYCSRSYPNMGEEVSICNWCLYEEDQSIISSATKASCAAAAAAASLKAEPAAFTTISTNEELRHHDAAARSHGEHTVLQCQLGNHVFEGDDDVMVKKGHTKAFEYLLLVAAQSLPQLDHNGVISNANTEINQDKHTTIITTPKRDSLAVGKANKNPDIMKANSTVTPLVNIVNVGPTQDKARTSPTNHRLGLSLHTNQNIRLHSQVKITIDHKNMQDVGRLIGGSIPKRQRCSKGSAINASLKCRKKGLHLSPSRPANYRRYKLLADVVC